MLRKRGGNNYIADDENRISPGKGETRQFSMDGGAREPAELAEERGSIRDYTLPALIWRFSRPALLLIISAALVVWMGTAVFNYVKGNYFDPAGSDPSSVQTVQIKTGSSLSSIATTLYDTGLIRNKFVFQMYADFNDKGSSMQAGTYKISPAMSMDEIIAILEAGDGGRKTTRVTLTEGMTIEDMATTLVQKGVFDATEKAKFLELCKDPYAFDDRDFISAFALGDSAKQRKYILEGYLFPDTYELYLDSTPEDIINKLLDRFDEIFTLEYADQANKLGMSIDQIMALASMIEWEGLPQDFKKVSAVFHNRLSHDPSMPLQSGATMRYVTGEKKLSYTKEELAIDDPYNTETKPGLPPGPVCNPGKQAIEAALYPDEQYVTDGYLYFCNKAPDSGELAFAITLDEHHKNTKAYEDAVAAQASASPSPSK